MLLPFVGGILVFVVPLIGNTLYPLIEQIVKYKIPLGAVAKLAVFNIPTLLVLTLPAGMALSAAWAVNRMARDSEVTAIRMAGVPVRRLFLPIYIAGLLCSIASFWIGDRVVPRAQHEKQQTEEQMFAYAVQSSDTVAQGKVLTYQNYAFSIGAIHKDPGGDPNKLRLERVLIIENAADVTRFPTWTTARTADYNRNVWTLHDVVTHTTGEDGFTTVELASPQATLNLRVPLASLAENAARRPDELTMRQLGEQLAALRATGQDDKEIAINYYSKLSLPFICLAFALCAPPLALRFSRAGAYVGLGVTLLMAWVAWNMLLLAKYLGSAGALSPFLAAWSPTLLFMALGLIFLWKVE